MDNLNITDKDIIDNLIVYRNDKYILNTCRIKVSWLKSHNLYDYLMNRYVSVKNILEIIYRIFYNIPDDYSIECKTCGKHIDLLFKSFILGYKEYCCNSCAANDHDKLKLIDETILDNDLSDEIILNKLIDKGRIVSEYCKIKKIKLFGYFTYLDNRYNDLRCDKESILEILYRMYNKIEVNPVCPTCGKEVKFYRFSNGYRRYCSNYCNNSNIDNILNKISTKRNTIEKRWLDKGYNIKYKNKDEFIVYDLCDIHNPFIIRDYIFFNRAFTNITMCPVCNPLRNKETNIEVIIRKILDKYCILYRLHIRNIISPRELDFYIEEYKLGIECNGIYWHSGKKGKDVMDLKYRMCLDVGILLLTFWEDDILNNIDKIEKIILCRCNKLLEYEVINYYIREISLEESKEFLDKYYLGEYKKSHIHLGLYIGNELIMDIDISKIKGNNYLINSICYNYCYNRRKCLLLLLNYIKDNYIFNDLIYYYNVEVDDYNDYNLLFELTDMVKYDIRYFNYKLDNRVSKNNIDKSDEYFLCYTKYIKLIYKK